MRFMLTALVAGGLALSTPAAAHHYQYHQPADPWAVLGGMAAGAIIGGIILEATRPPPPPPVVIYQPPPPPFYYQPPPPQCGAVYLGDDAWGRPMFGNWCR